MLPKDYKRYQYEYDKQEQAKKQRNLLQSPYVKMQQSSQGMQLETRFVNNDNENDNIYLNVVIDHNNLVTFYPQIPPPPPNNIPYLIGTAPQYAEYNTTKTIPILNKCSDYYCSVIRFSIPLDTIPLFIMPIVPNQFLAITPPGPDPDLTPLLLGVRYLGIDYYVNLDYISRGNPTVYPAPIQDQLTQVVTPYYYVYSYQVLIDMLNVALRTVLTASGILAALPAPPTPPLINPNLPYFYLDAETNLISLIYPIYFANLTAPLTDVPTIFINSLLKSYLDAFDFSFIGFDQPNGRDFQFLLTSPSPDKIFYPANFILPPNATAQPTQSPIIFYRVKQEYSSLQYWTSLRKLIISTNTIPIVAESIPAINQSTDLNVSYPILSDFIPNIEGSAGTSRTIAFYLPDAQYRLVDLIGDNSLQKLDLKVFWQDLDGNLFPMTISANQQIDIKLGFFRKTLYKNRMMKD